MGNVLFRVGTVRTFSHLLGPWRGLLAFYTPKVNGLRDQKCDQIHPGLPRVYVSIQVQCIVGVMPYCMRHHHHPLEGVMPLTIDETIFASTRTHESRFPSNPVSTCICGGSLKSNTP